MNKCKKALLGLGILAVAASVSQAAPLVTIGDQLDVFFNGYVGGKYDSNVTLENSNKIEDWALTITPGVEAVYGRNSKFKASVLFQEQIIRYLDNSQFNAELANVVTKASYEMQRATVAADFSFRQLYQNTAQDLGTINAVSGLIRRDSYKGGLNATYDFSDKIDATAAFRFNGTVYQNYTDIYSDQYDYSLPLSVYYKVTERISVGLAYRATYTQLFGGLGTYNNDRLDNFGGLTAKGEITEKLKGEFYVGVVAREVMGTDSGDDTTFSFNAKINYQVTEKISTYLKGGRNFRSGSSSQSYIATDVVAGAAYQATDKISTFVEYTFENDDYAIGGRSDNIQYVSFGASYQPVRYFTLSAVYNYSNDDCSLDGVSYQKNLVDIRATVRY